MHHSHEEIRAVFFEFLNRDGTCGWALNYDQARFAIAKMFDDRGSRSDFANGQARLTLDDEGTLLEVFWEAFRDGIITLGAPPQSQTFPVFRLSHFGLRIIENPDTYFFHDLSSYEKVIRSAVPKIDPNTLLYLKEAMQAFRAGCILSATVMLGVAAEHTLNLVLETIEKNTAHSARFQKALKETKILRRMNEFKKILDREPLSPEIKEDLDTRFTGIQSVIRESRNEAGHPTGKILDREMAYVLLNLFPSYCKKMYQLIAHCK